MSGGGQLGFDDLLASAEADNEVRKFERATAHLPGSMEEAMPFYRNLIERHHAAMLAADVDEAMRLREEAHDLARKLNDGEPGIIAHDDAPGCVLERETAAAPGKVPLWGQAGSFEIAASGMRVRIEMEGVFGIASGFYFWPGFSANAVELDRPFLSGTGYRSFLGILADPQAGLTPEVFTAKVIAAFVENGLKGRLEDIAPRYCEREE